MLIKRKNNKNDDDDDDDDDVDDDDDDDDESYLNLNLLLMASFYCHQSIFHFLDFSSSYSSQEFPVTWFLPSILPSFLPSIGIVLILILIISKRPSPPAETGFPSPTPDRPCTSPPTPPLQCIFFLRGLLSAL